MSFASIGIVTTIPVTVPAETTGALATTGGKGMLEITGKSTVGTGSLYLLRWFADLAEWRPWREYHAMSVAAATLSGFFSGSYEVLPGNEYWLLYDPTATITATASGRIGGVK